MKNRSLQEYRRSVDAQDAYLLDSASKPNLNKVFVGIVKDNRDLTRMGRLRVFIPEMGGRHDDESKWYTVQYCSPFAGATNPVTVTKDAKSIKGVQQSYGFWAVPPDLENLVVVMFINGEASRGIWVGCLYQQNVNHMVPGIPSGDSFEPGATVDNRKIAPPVAEYNKRINQTNSEDAVRARFTPLHDSLDRQGLYRDDERGPSSGGARREAPSQVFGFKTPRGHHFYIDDGEIDVDPSTKRPIIQDQEIRRKRGSNEYIRIRTRSGAQILINDTTGYIYMNTRSGSSWLELSDNGVEVYTNGKFNLRSENEINIHADKDINIHAGGSFNLFASGGISLGSDDKIDIASRGKYRQTSNQSVEINANGKVVVSTGSQISIKSGNVIGMQAPKIVQNTVGSGNASPAEIKRPEGKRDISNGSETSTPSIVTDLVTHEPYINHPRREQSATSNEIEFNTRIQQSGTSRPSNYRGSGEVARRSNPIDNTPIDVTVGNCATILASKYESRGNPGAIGYDVNGGYSYGTVQIAARVGSMGSFLRYAEQKDPELAAELQAAGGEAGARAGDQQFKDKWQELAKRDPQRFNQVQKDWNAQANFGPTQSYIESKYGINLDENPTLKAALYSTATQHGPAGANRVFDRALAGKDPNEVSNLPKEELIDRLYAERGRTNPDGRLAYFSDPAVQRGVKNRLVNERNDALQLLEAEKAGEFPCKDETTPAEPEIISI